MLIKPVIHCSGSGTRLWPEGQGVNETGTVAAVTGDKSPAVAVGDVLVKIDPLYFRPPKWKPCWATPPKPRKNSAGCQKSHSTR